MSLPVDFQLDAVPFPWTCPDCRTKTVANTRRDFSASVRHDGVSHLVTLSDIDIPTCTTCGQAVIPDFVSEQITVALRRTLGLLSPKQIQTEREGLGLSRIELAAAIRVPESQVARWEAGEQLQTGSHDLLLRLFFDSAAVRSACVVGGDGPTNASELTSASSSV